MPLSRLADSRARCAPLLGTLLRTLRCGAALFLALLLCGGRAVAEESEAARLFQEGRALLVEGRFAEACSRLEQSQQLEPRLGTKLNIAFCQERLGKLGTAWRVFQEALSSARAEGDVAREAFAKSRMDALAPRLPSLKVRAASADQLTLLLDGAALAPAQWNAEVPVDPGEHTLVAAYIGEEYWRRTVTLRESEHVDVAIPAAPEETVPLETGAAGTHTTSRFVFEIAAFIGYLNVDTRLSTADVSPTQTVSDDDGTTRRLSCASSSCDHDYLGSTSGFVVGVGGLVGYAVAPDTHLGLRFLVGPRAGGGILAALGPTASLRLSERFRVGPTLLLGTASHTASGFSQLRDGNDTYNIFSRLNGSLQLAIGLGAELDYELLSNPAGSILLQATPLWLYGDNGIAFSLPVGVAYRWN